MADGDVACIPTYFTFEECSFVLGVELLDDVHVDAGEWLGSVCVWVGVGVGGVGVGVIVIVGGLLACE